MQNHGQFFQQIFVSTMVKNLSVHRSQHKSHCSSDSSQAQSALLPCLALSLIEQNEIDINALRRAFTSHISIYGAARCGAHFFLFLCDDAESIRRPNFESLALCVFFSAVNQNELVMWSAVCFSHRNNRMHQIYLYTRCLNTNGLAAALQHNAAEQRELTSTRLGRFC